MNADRSRLIADRIRQTIRRAGPEPHAQVAPLADGPTGLELESLQATYDLGSVSLEPRKRRRAGFLLVRARRFLQRLLGPTLERQTTHNAANVRLTTHLLEHVAALEGTVAALKGSVTALEGNVTRLNRVTEASGGVFEMPQSSEFTDHFRGPEEEIGRRQAGYVARYAGLEDVLDIGCGRGEFLALLRDAGIRAHGVDVDPEMIARCRAQELEVFEDDVFSYLDEVEDNSLGGVFCAQVIEHLTPAEVLDLIRLAVAKVRSGGVVLVETPNPEALATFAAFYLDLSHVRPYNFETVAWMFGALGLHDVEIEFSLPSDEARAEEHPLVYGPRVYAVVGRKP